MYMSHFMYASPFKSKVTQFILFQLQSALHYCHYAIKSAVYYFFSFTNEMMCHALLQASDIKYIWWSCGLLCYCPEVSLCTLGDPCRFSIIAVVNNAEGQKPPWVSVRGAGGGRQGMGACWPSAHHKASEKSRHRVGGISVDAAGKTDPKNQGRVCVGGGCLHM